MTTSDPEPDDPSYLGHGWDEPEDPALHIRPLWLPETFDELWPSSYQSWAFRFDRLLGLVHRTVQSITPKTPHTEALVRHLGGLFGALHRLTCDFLLRQGGSGYVSYMDSRMDVQSRLTVAHGSEPSGSPPTWLGFRGQIESLLETIAETLGQFAHVPALVVVQHDLVAMAKAKRAANPDASAVKLVAGSTVTKRRASLTDAEKKKQLLEVLNLMGIGLSMREACKSVGINQSTFRSNVDKDEVLGPMYLEVLARHRARHSPPARDEDPD